MTPEAQRIAIAEACGWKTMSDHFLTPDGRFSTIVRDGGKWHLPDASALPDYLNDLNEMHIAEKTLAAGQRAKYAQLLLEPQWQQSSRWDCAHASAEKRAKAFLMVLNLWKDEP